MFESSNCAGAMEKLPCSGKPVANISSWSYDMEGHAKKFVERYCEPINLRKKKMVSVGELSKVCSQIVLKCLHLARIGRHVFSWSVNKLVRAVTKWTKACDKRFARLISHTSEFK